MNSIFQCLSVSFFALVLCGATPPLGQRRYVIDSSAPTAPVRIEKSHPKKPSTGTYLKDPLHLFPTKRKQEPTKKPQRPIVKKRPGLFRFQALPIDGRLTKPRVAFDNRVLPLERADEPIDRDFFEKVFAPAMEADF